MGFQLPPLPRRWDALAVAVAWAGLVISCASVSGSLVPDAEVRAREFFVLNHGRDQRRIDQMIASSLSARGFTASSGFDADKPDHVDVLVTYEDRWQWDMTNYLIRLTIQFHDEATNTLLGSGESYRPSLQRKSPEFVVNEVLDSILGSK